MTTPGWYQDPRFPGLMRWWDGQSWTEHTQPAAGLLPAPQPQIFHQPAFAGPDPAKDLADATKAAHTAAVAVYFGAAAYIAQYFGAAFAFHTLWRTFRQWMNEPRQADGSLPALQLHGLGAYNAVSDLASVVLLVVGVLFLIWFHKAATMAARLGLRARRSPGWAVGAFFLPIVNWWFPYRSALDLFPPDHPGRAVVRRWWTLWLVMSLVSIPLVIVGYFSEAGAVVIAVLATALAVGAAASVRVLVVEVTRCHAELSSRK
jgi:hypothetical protein